MNQLYATARQRLLKATLDWEDTDLDVRLLLFNTAYTFVETHTTVTNVGTPKAQSELLLVKSATSLGYARSSAAVFASIAVGAPVTFGVLVEDIGGAASTWKLLAYIDEAEGLPFTPNGIAYKVVPDWLSSQGWFRA